jgi:hypothetical protein
LLVRVIDLASFYDFPTYFLEIIRQGSIFVRFISYFTVKLTVSTIVHVVILNPFHL